MIVTLLVQLLNTDDKYDQGREKIGTMLLGVLRKVSAQFKGYSIIKSF